MRNDSKLDVLQQINVNKLANAKSVSGSLYNKTNIWRTLCTEGNNNVKCYKVIVNMPENVYK